MHKPITLHILTMKMKGAGKVINKDSLECEANRLTGEVPTSTV